MLKKPIFLNLLIVPLLVLNGKKTLPKKEIYTYLKSECALKIGMST